MGTRRKGTRRKGTRMNKTNRQIKGGSYFKRLRIKRIRNSAAPRKPTITKKSVSSVSSVSLPSSIYSTTHASPKGKNAEAAENVAVAAAENKNIDPQTGRSARNRRLTRIVKAGRMERIKKINEIKQAREERLRTPHIPHTPNGENK